MRFKDFKKKTFTMSYDDGVDQDKKLLQIMNKNGLKGTFNINSGMFTEENFKFPDCQIHRRMTLKQAYDLYVNSDCEVALHGLTHSSLQEMNPENVLYEILEDRRKLENIFGKTIRGMAYPFGTFNDNVINAAKLAGVAYSRTVVSTEKFDIPNDWLRLPATCHHNNANLLKLGKSFLELNVIKASKMFYLWGHSYQFEQDDNWDTIEKFAELIGKSDDIWYATNIEIYDYISAFKSLRFSVDMSFVENPTSTELFFEFDGKEYSIKSGQSLSLKN